MTGIRTQPSELKPRRQLFKILTTMSLKSVPQLTIALKTPHLFINNLLLHSFHTRDLYLQLSHGKNALQPFYLPKNHHYLLCIKL